MYGWEVTCSTVTLWRKALGVGGLTGTEGTRRLVQAGQERRMAIFCKNSPHASYHPMGAWTLPGGGATS
jgi:hypothetical protein